MNAHRLVIIAAALTVLVATHDPDLIGIADEALELEDGKIRSQQSRTSRRVPRPGPARPRAGLDRLR